MVTIKKAAELTGVPAHTLRAWERRYGLFAPTRTESGYRHYDADALARISAMAALVADGWSPRDAAAHLSGPDAAAPPPRAATAAREASLIDAAAALDAARISRLFDEQFALADFETVVGTWLMPALDRLGRAWAAGTVSVAGEHLVANIALRRLSAAYEAAGRGSGRPVVVGAPPGVQHEIGLLAFAVAARRRGLATLYLGAEVPVDAWSQAVAASSARAVVTSAPRRPDAARVALVVERLAADHPGVTVWVGGRHQHLVPAPARPLGHDIGEAARVLAEAAIKG